MADAGAVRELWASLPIEDRQCRFFGGGSPGLHVAERWVGGPGGFVLVAEEGDRLVGEVGCGGGPPPELGITVAGPERGWLGPFLLDALLVEAGARGIPCVAAEVLAINRRMLAVVAARGYAVLPSGDPTTVRVLLGTTGPVPGWPASGRRRVLLELGAGASAARALDAAGFDVVTCRGPSPRARRWRCPVLEGRPCPLVDGAHAVVVAPDGDDDHARLVRLLHEQHPCTTVVEVRDGARSEEVEQTVRHAVLAPTAGTSIPAAPASPAAHDGCGQVQGAARGRVAGGA